MRGPGRGDRYLIGATARERLAQQRFAMGCGKCYRADEEDVHHDR